MYIGAVAVLPTYAPLVAVLIEGSVLLLARLLEESKSGKQALREVRLKHQCLSNSLSLTGVTAVWGDGVRGSLHVLGSVSATRWVLVPYVSPDRWSVLSWNE